MKNRTDIAITSSFFETYEKFKEDCEKMGWTYHTKFMPFEQWCMESCSCLYFSFGWSDFPKTEMNLETYSKPMFSFSNPSNAEVIDIDRDYDNGLIAVWELLMSIREISKKDMERFMAKDIASLYF